MGRSAKEDAAQAQVGGQVADATEHPPAILTSLAVETAAVRAHLIDVETLQTASGLNIYTGRLTPGSGRVVLAQVDAQHGGMVRAVDQLTRMFHPEFFFFVGLAAGLRADMEIGDVVVATRVYAYRGGVETPEGIYARPRAWSASHRMVQVSRLAVRRAEQMWDWAVHFGPIAAGDVQLTEADPTALLRATSSDAAAIEMEGAGLAHAAHLIDSMDFLTVRGISDKADASKGHHQAKSQEHAAANAVAVAVAVLSELERTSGSAPGSEPSHTAYGGDHVDFRGNLFMGTVIGKVVSTETPQGDNKQ
ncbi:5'-methylthioadenosine/S-adenosylhomocysteine nucleosidase family protein [Streptomyces sp. NPDC002306]